MTILTAECYLPASHKASCATLDPVRGFCDCGAQPIPMVSLAQAQEAVKLAPNAAKVFMICTAYEQGVGKGRQDHASGKDTKNPYSEKCAEHIAWNLGRKEGLFQAARAANAAN